MGDAFVSVDGAVGLSQPLGKVVAVEEPFRIPIDSRLMRWTARMLDFAFPKPYRLKMAFLRNLNRQDRETLRPHDIEVTSDSLVDPRSCREVGKSPRCLPMEPPPGPFRSWA